ncbi:hypothetical protein ABZ128_23615 [Streptomyces sp. NPDC006326]|uniref:hypothetical protein n=1 Tax=Streptomyces sp. NPDC006326 TaxID=3156752 RepID=UPI0033A210FD
MLAMVLAVAGCSLSGEEKAAVPACVSDSVPPALLKKYSLPALPHSEAVRFCETPDKDGSSARLTFRSDPKDSDAYLKSLDMDPAEFIDSLPGKVEELSQDKGDAWALDRNAAYKAGMKAIDWNGQCLVDYQAYIRKTPDWDGTVYIGLYCQV